MSFNIASISSTTRIVSFLKPHVKLWTNIPVLSTLAAASVSVAMALAVGKQARADAEAVATWPSGHMDGDVRMGCCELAILEVRMIEVAVVPR